ncbi:MAG: hypothetical protein HY879_15350 [Deltaproteobacteria bacterium]|nr:hypothetical protein [Deltaproteobacteria bacterium]
MKTVKLFFYGLLVMIFVLFVIQNYATLTYSISIRLNLGFLALESIPLPFFLIAPILFFSGLLLATLIGLVERRRLSKELKLLRTTLQESKPVEKPIMESAASPDSSGEIKVSPEEHPPPVHS